MARSIQYIFPPAKGAEICVEQSLLAAGNLIINGSLAVNGTVSFISHGYSRQISIVSDNDLSGVNFTIIGTQNGVEVVDIIAGPDADIVFSNSIFDTVNSIFANNAAADVIVGAGYNGFFSLIDINLERNNIDYTLTLGKLTNNATGTQVFAGVSSIINNGLTYLDNIDNNYSLVEIKALGVSNQYLYTNRVNFEPTYSYLLVFVSGDDADLLNSMQLNFIQI